MNRALTPVEAALAPVLARLRPVEPVACAPHAAIGAFLAETQRAAGPIPARAIALADGYAVDSLSTTGASPYAPTMMLAAPRQVGAGDELPEGCDAVAPVEAVVDQGGWFEIVEAIEPGRDARAAGADLKPGAVIAEAGARVTPLLALVLAQAGISQFPVRRPTVMVLGDVDGLSPALEALFIAWGCEISAREDANLVLAIGAAPVGSTLLHGLALRPGEAAGVGRVGETPLLLLPARFDGAVAGFLALATPVIGRLVDRTPAPHALTLTRKISSAVGLTDIVLLEESDGRATPLGVGEITLAALARATAALLVGPESEGFPAGATVAAIRLAAPFG